MTDKDIDLVCIGRSSVDLYGQQVGGRLEDMASFAKYVGGSPTNTAIGVSRLGLKSALITRVGDEHMGRYIRNTLSAEGVYVGSVITDPERLTALVILGIQDEEHFPLVFFRENCADMAICEDDIDQKLLARSRTLLLSGTHLSTAKVAKASKKAIKLARQHNVKVVLDVDYRPNLWGLSGHGDGENRFIASDEVSQHLQNFLPYIDLIVGTEEEFHIAGGSTDTLTALANVRQKSNAVMVCKRGAMGCFVFDGEVNDWHSGIQGQGFAVEVFNVLGAGDAFMSGLLRGWITGADWATSCTYANACGAFAVSRHGCSPAIPSWQELQYFLQHGSEYKALRHDPALNHIHAATNRRRYFNRIVAFAIDHRQQFIAWAKAAGRSINDIGKFKQLAVTAVMEQADNEEGLGMLLDDRTGRDALHQITSSQAWVGRPIEESGHFPLAFEGGDELLANLIDWPLNQTVKVLCPYRMDDDLSIRQQQDEKIIRLAKACAYTGHEWLLEIITTRQDKPFAAQQIPLIMQHFYQLGVKPDWWKLEPSHQSILENDKYWQTVGAVIDQQDPYCQGILVLGLEASIQDLSQAFASAVKQPWVKGFAIGRSLFAQAAQDWLHRRIDDMQAINIMKQKYQQTIAAWDMAKANATKSSKVSYR